MLHYFYRRATWNIDAFMTRRRDERTAFLREKVATLLGIVARRDLFRGDRHLFGHQAVYTANRRAGRHYVPGPFDGPAVLFLTRDRPIPGERNYRLDWLDLVPQIGTPVYVPGKSSGDMLSLPHVYELAEIVNSHLEAAQAKDATVPQREHAVS